jgi:hypothetical protein
VSLFTRGCRVSQVHINRQRSGVKCSVPNFTEDFASQIPDPSPLSRETRSAQHSQPRRGGGAGGGGTSSCRPGDGTRTVSRSTARSPLPRDPLRQTQPTPPRGRGRGWGNNKLSFQRWHVSVSVIDSTSPLSRETRSAQHSRPRRGGGAGGGGTSSCRPGDDMRTVSPSTTRPLIRPLGTFPRRGKAPL